MAKLMKVYNNDKKEYERLKRNIKNKIRSYAKKGIDISNEIHIPNLGETTRKEFNQFKQEASEFTNRARKFVQNEYGVVTTQARLKKIERNTKKAIKLAEQELAKQNELPFHANGEVIGTVEERNRMRKQAEGIDIPKEFDFSKVRSINRLNTLEESSEKKSETGYYDKRKEQAKLNFIEILQGSFNSNSDELVEEITKMSGNDFWDLYLMFEEFDFRLYDSEGENVLAEDNALSEMLAYAKEYNAGNIDTSLKDF